MNRIKKHVTEWSKSISELWEEGQYLRAVLTFILPPVIIALLIVLIVLTVTKVLDFLRRYYAQLIMAALAVWAFLAWRDKHKAEQIQLEREAQEVRERQDYSDRLEAANVNNAAYTEQAKVLFDVSQELGALGIVPPMRLSDLYSPGRTISCAKGTVNLSLFLLQKDRETVDTDLLKHTVQTKIDQRLQAGEFPGIPERHIYHGHVYSGFVVDQVRDSMGGFVEVYTALVDDDYSRYRERLNLNKSILLPPVDRRDTRY